ncbi:MAG: response regulator [Polyangiaceae bacterium]
MAMDVLIVDDSATMRRIIGRALTMSGLPVRSMLEAEDGRSALELIARAKIDLALLDINMPGMNGIQALEALRESDATADLPVVVVSTEGSAPRLDRVRQLSAGFVRKPFTPEALIDAVIVAIGGRGRGELR